METMCSPVYYSILNRASRLENNFADATKFDIVLSTPATAWPTLSAGAYQVEMVWGKPKRATYLHRDALAL